MSYREENGQVVLTMSPDDFAFLLMGLGALMAYSATGKLAMLPIEEICGCLNRLNQGNPNYTPYQVAEKS